MPISDDTTFRFAAAVSTAADTHQAAHEAGRQVQTQLGARADLAFVFAAMAHQEQFDELADVLTQELGHACLLGCTGESIVGGAREYEGGPALAVWASHMPGVKLTPMHVEFQPTPDGGSFLGWPDELVDSWPAGSSLLLLADPFSFPADVLLARANDDWPGTRIFGGMASGGWGPRQNRLVLGSRVHDAGAVAVLVQGPVQLTSVVSQGCRPIGRPLVVTKAERNVIHELGGRPALVQLQELFGTLSAEDQRLMQQGLHVGQVIDEYRETFGRGDFLIRNVQGFDPQQKALAIGDYARVGQTVQFHVRDAGTADEDLRALLSAASPCVPGQAQGALLFTCNGRGTRLFDAPHHDAAALAELSGQPPTAGFFAQGEIGPIGGKNFLHGFTASIVFFSAP